MGCKDGKIVVICENFGKMVRVFLCGCLSCVRVCVSECVEQHAKCPNMHMTIDIFISLHHNWRFHYVHLLDSFWCSAYNILFRFLSIWKNSILRSFAPVQIKKWDRNRIDSICIECRRCPTIHRAIWCERDDAIESHIRCTWCTYNRIKEITRWCVAVDVVCTEIICAIEKWMIFWVALNLMCKWNNDNDFYDHLK